MLSFVRLSWMLPFVRLRANMNVRVRIFCTSHYRISPEDMTLDYRISPDHLRGVFADLFWLTQACFVVHTVLDGSEIPNPELVADPCADPRNDSSAATDRGGAVRKRHIELALSTWFLGCGCLNSSWTPASPNPKTSGGPGPKSTYTSTPPPQCPPGPNPQIP
jgi:hypothetical protein